MREESYLYRPNTNALVWCIEMDYGISIQGNTIEILRSFNDESIHLTLTSPPYDSIRNYGGFAFDLHVCNAPANELYRITADGGVVVRIVGDQTINGSDLLS